MLRLTVLALLLSQTVLAQPAPAPAPPPEAAEAARPAASDRTTAHVLRLPDRTLSFNATVSTMRLANPQGAAQAEVVTTAFTLSNPAGPRPVTFVFNGGPGAASAWLNLGAVGPWRIPFSGAPSARPELLDNAETWLDFTDLVFIDPPGTGFSRITATGDDVRRRIWSVEGDIQTLAVVVRRWLDGNRRLQSPKFLAGESYGGFRAPLLARALLDDQGVGVSGLVLVSPVLDFNGRDAPWSPLEHVGRLPSMAAAANDAGGRTQLREVEEYAAGEFLNDLVRGERDAAATARLSARVAAYTGMDPALVRRRAGRLDIGTFVRDREPGRVASPYDATVTAADPFPAAANDNSPDAILDGLRGPVTSAMLELYARLNWTPEGAPGRQYQLLNTAVAREWDYGRGNRRPESFSALRQFVGLDPNARVLVTHGLTDLVTPYFGTKLLLDQMPEALAGERVRLQAYPGGHMFYSRDGSRAALHGDAGQVIGGR